MSDPNSPVEQKFDFTDKELCNKCMMFEMFQEDAKVVQKFAEPNWPKLKGEGDNFIKE